MVIRAGVNKWPVSARSFKAACCIFTRSRHRSPARVYEPTSAYRDCFPESGQAAFHQTDPRRDQSLVRRFTNSDLLLRRQNHQATKCFPKEDLVREAEPNSSRYEGQLAPCCRDHLTKKAQNLCMFVGHEKKVQFSLHV